MPTNTPRQIDAVRKTSHIITSLQEHGSAGVTEIATDVGYSKSTVHGHLATLHDEGLIVKDDHTYRLSLSFLDIAESVKRTVAEHDVVREQIRALADETGEVVHFGAQERGRVVYLEKAKGNSAVQTKSTIGGRMPMHSTGLGKAILSTLPPETVDRIVEEHGLEQRTEHTITSADELTDELEATAARGYSIDDEENIPGVRCIGMVVSVPETEVIGAVSISGPSQRMTDERLETELQPTIAQAANVIEVNSLYS
ncbi:IclR family transcriptional regulator [Natronolimnobius baerhuensis]|nr:IclR family transcriptional regulator [Natronolimnobius baerhuensis]